MDHVYSRSLYLGVDGGNTKTIALVADDSGTIRGAGRSGCGDIYGAARVDEALGAIETAARQALEQAGAQPRELSAAVFSLAGADWPEDYALYLDELTRRLGLPPRTSIVNDAIGALRAGTEDGLGVSIVCGTFGAVGARSASGATWHASFWLERAGARELGQRALRAVFRAHLGLGTATSLTAPVLELYGERDPETLLHRLTRRREDEEARPEVGWAAGLVLDHAEAGDPAAREIVDSEAARLSDVALVAASKVGLDPSYPVVLAGGVFRHPSALLRDAIGRRIRVAAPEARIVTATFPPAAGALLLALGEDDADISSETVGRLDRSIAPLTLFSTAPGV
jgi:N-acetylglucosamine kinase-like BadF-type ATPase